MNMFDYTKTDFAADLRKQHFWI